MPRTFASASSEKIDLSLGTGASVNGAITLAAIVKRAADGTAHQVINIGTVAASARRLNLGSANVVQIRSNGVVVSGATTVVAADGWAFIAATKAAGTATPRLHIYKYATGTWVHENAGATLADSTPATASCIGYNGASANYFNGDIAIAGAWAAELTDAQVEALAYSLPAWWAVQPNGLWILDQSATDQKVVDLTGGGANESGITGTSVSTSAVPIFSYGHPVIVERVTSAAGAAVALTGSGANASAGTGSLTVTPSFVHQLSGSGANASGGSAALSLGIALSGYGAAASGGIIVTLTDTPAEPTGGFAPHRPPFRPALPARPLRISRRRRYIASKSCTFGIRAVRYRHARPGTRTHTAHITHRATRPATTSRAHAAGMTGSSTRSAHHDAEMRCDLYKPYPPERVAARLAELYAELL